MRQVLPFIAEYVCDFMCYLAHLENTRGLTSIQLSAAIYFAVRQTISISSQ